MDKIKILVAPSDIGACDLYRSSGPHKKLQEMFPNDYEIDIKYLFDFKDIDYILKYDIIQLHNGVYRDYDRIIEVLKQIKNKVIIIIDFDDYGILPENHEAYKSLLKYNGESKNLELLQYADYITCTQDYFNSILSKYNQNVITIPNAIDMSFTFPKTKSDRIRFGFTGSRSHYHDYKQFENVTKNLPKEILDKCQFVLCGFDLDEGYYKYENLITSNYSIISNEYKEWLLKFEEVDITLNEPYIRKGCKPIDRYLSIYMDIDVLIAPLLPCEFNNCKSNLKFLEAAATNTAIIATNTGPYATIGKNIMNNNLGNCILVEPNQDDGISAIKKVILNPALIDISKMNLRKNIFQFDIRNITKLRNNIYKQIIWEKIN